GVVTDAGPEASAASKDLLHQARRLGPDFRDVEQHALEGVAPLEKRLELLGRVPRGVAMDVHVPARVGLHERLQLLAPRVLLNMPLQRLHRTEDELPLVRRDDRVAGGRPGDVVQRGGGRGVGRHQKSCPQTTCPTIRATAKAARIRLSRMKKIVDGPASSVVKPPKLSTG